MNILPIIALWLEQHSSHEQSGMSRAELIAWMRRPSLNGKLSIAKVYCGTDCEDIGLAADCLIAAGIGREEEQEKTVYCRCSY